MQHDLFEHDPGIRQLIGHIDNIPAPELESRWPRSVVDLIDVLENELKRQNVSNPRELARKQAVALSCFLGGRQFYIPCGDTILTALRDDLLYCQFNGRNMEELRRQYRLSQPQIYQIIARQRKLHTRRHQPDLFSPESQK
ncbi:positive regulator of late transcription [Escherichia coli]|nr:positive regulator of late transcription [Escherichia coli]